MDEGFLQFCQPSLPNRQPVSGGSREVTCRIHVHSAICIAATCRTDRRGITLDVLVYDRCDSLVRITPALCKSCLLLTGINHPKVIDAGILLGSIPGFHERRDGYRGQKAYDRHHDHDFYQGETQLFHVLCLLCYVAIATPQSLSATLLCLQREKVKLCKQGPCQIRI